jgi:hypothetical protein
MHCSRETVQEVLQDAAHDYYGAFSPIVFLSSPTAPASVTGRARCRCDA